MDKVLFITDTYKDLNIKKDTSILMIEEAIKHKFNVFQCEINDLFVKDGIVYASSRNIISAGLTQVESILKEDLKVSDFRFSFMRKDPPVDENYVNALHLLGLAEKQGAIIFNRPNSIKEFNEKVFALHFKEYIPHTLLTSKINKIESFFESHQEIIIKPLDGMGGASIYKIDDLNEENISILNEMTNSGKTQIICQEFIEDIYDGDFRILIIHGKPFQKTLARIPQGGSFKGNLAAGGKGVAKDISDFQRKVGEEIGNFLIKKGINFAGVDIIGEYLTEINITSPTCAREILDQTDINPITEYFQKL
ncbi:MAG: glutathione synthase [Gammaproteobacteria bacterium TMED226]|nr:MAG: glutathione synthase [Gammaproteobacteria bacterium TMED226]